jgi:peptide/nickel transport system substrate-binding protein
MKKPDTRIIGGIFVWILPEHVWGKQTIKQLTGSYRPEMPMVGSGPYIVTEFDSNRIVRMERNPNWRGDPPAFDEVQWIKYGSGDAVERALTLGEIDLITEVEASTFDRLSKTENIKAVKSPSPSFTELAFNLCPRDICPDAKYNPAVQDLTVRQAIGFAVDRERINQIANRGTSFAGHGLLPSYYKDFYTQPEGDLDYPYDPDRAREMLEQAGWSEGEGGVREKGGQRLSFDLYVRSESQENRQAARLVKEMTAPIGVEFKIQNVSADKLYDLTVREVDGKMAPDFDTFIWGWGGDPYDPGLLLNLLTTNAIGGSSDAFYSNPEYDRLYDQQSGEFDTDARRAIVKQMIDITQRDLPYLVLTVDPILQAYRTDRLAGVEQSCPKPDGDIICDQVSYAPWLNFTPPAAAAATTTQDEGGSSGLLFVLIAVVVVVIALVAYVVIRRRRADREAIEV